MTSLGTRGPGPQVRQAERGVDRVALRLVERDLQLGPPARRLVPHQLVGGHAERVRERLDQGELGLAPAVLQQRQHRRGAADPLAELGERQAPAAPDVPQPLAEENEIQSAHSGKLAKSFSAKVVTS